MEENTSKSKIELHGGEIAITKNTTSTYLVEKGTVLVYMVPILKSGQYGRRFLIHEAQEGEVIPSFYKELHGSIWTFALTALDSAQVREQPETMSNEQGAAFVTRAGLQNIGEKNYEELLFEVYDRNCVKEEGYIYANQQEKEFVKDKGLRLIYRLFDRTSARQSTPESGNILYDAFAYVCDHAHIRIAPVDKVIASAGRRFGPEDISRVSNFIVREVILEDGWIKKDSDFMVGFLEKGHKAVALLPKSGGGYAAYHPDSHRRMKVTSEFQGKLEAKAYALYASFPNRTMTIWDMFLFGLKKTNICDWLRFCLFTLLGTLIGILLPMLSEQIYDNYIPLGASGSIAQICFVLLACNIGNLSFTIVKNMSALRGVSKMKNAVLSALCERIFNLPESFYREYQSVELSDRVLKIESVFSLLSEVGFKTFISAVFSILYLVQMNQYSHELMKISILLVVIVLAVIAILSVLQLKYEKELIESNSNANGRMYQYLMGIQKIRGAGVEDRALLEYLAPYVKAKEITMRKERMKNVVEILSTGAGSILTVIIYYQMIKNQMTLSIGQFSAFMAALGAFLAAVMEVGTSLLKLNGIVPALERLRPILNTAAEYADEAELPGELTGEIELSNVDFSYNSDGPNVIEDLSIHICAGEYIGIVGQSGCGKSTLLKLLLGFEKPTSGKIFYDSRDIDRLNKREMRKKFGVVLQDGRLISGSIFDNITIAAPGATMKDAQNAAEQAGLMDDIERMPMGMHTVLSETGGTISGGQQQRILIARAIVGKPKILFFDEATSALDNVTQAMVSESLKGLHATRLVIAHRLSTVADCDRILVMDKGRVVEEGNYETLMKKKGLFYELASRQMA